MDYGITNYKGKEYILLEQAKYAGIQNLRIDDSIYVLDENNYSAKCKDKKGKEYIAYFVVKNDVENVEDLCDWENANYIAEI